MAPLPKAFYLGVLLSTIILTVYLPHVGMVLSEVVSDGRTCGQDLYPAMLHGVAPSAKDLVGVSLATRLLGTRAFDRWPSRTRKRWLIRSRGEAKRQRDRFGSVKWKARMWHRQNRRFRLYKVGEHEMRRFPKSVFLLKFFQSGREIVRIARRSDVRPDS